MQLICESQKVNNNTNTVQFIYHTGREIHIKYDQIDCKTLVKKLSKNPIKWERKNTK